MIKFLPKILIKSTHSISVPELEVNLIGARHLPSNFGLKTVEGYMIKVSRYTFLLDSFADDWLTST